MDKMLPSNIEAERAVLGSVLLNRDAVIAIAAWLQPDDFYTEQHAWIYEAMLHCYNNRVPPDTRTVSDELRRKERLDPIGGLPYLLTLVDTVPSSYHIEYYAQIVQRTALLRKLISAGGQIARIGYDESQDIEATFDKAETALFEVSQRRTTQDFVHIGQVIDTYYEQINYLQEHRGEVVGVPTGLRDLDEVTGGLQRSDLIILAARPAVGKCLTAHTLIDDPATGERVTIEHYVKQQRPTVLSMSQDGVVQPAMIAHWIDSGVQPCFRVRTRSGREVEVTAKHPFFTVGGWMPLRELTVGTQIGVPRQLPVFGQSTMPLELVRLLAYYIAEGGLTGTSPGFTNTDPVIVEDFTTIIARFFPTCAVRQHGISYFASRPGRGGIPTPNPVYTWLETFGLKGKLARDKFFPSCVWTWPRDHLAEFIRVLMSCDGSIYLSIGRQRIEFTVAAPQLAADLHHAFVRFGIVAKLCQTSHGAWRVAVTEPQSIRRYQQEIGWIGEKAHRFVDLPIPVTKRGSNLGHPPQATWQLVCAAAQQQGLAMVELARRSGETTSAGKYGGYNPHLQRSIPRARLSGYANVLNNQQLRAIAGPDVYWDEIIEITPIGSHQVYDLTVPEGANFVAQDIFVHNTSFAMSVAHGVAKAGNGIVGIFSLEMSRDQLVQRMLAMETGIDTHKLRTGHIRDNELQLVMEAMGRLASLPVYIEDTAGMSIMEVRSKARRLQSRVGIDLLVIDYLQLMQGRGRENRVQEVGEISRGLKALARELNIPVIALSQLSRAVEGRTSHVPMLSDLRESGSIEQDADIVMFIYRDELYNPESDKKGIAEIHIAKHRNGPVAVVPMRFEASTTKFSNLTYRTPEGY